MHAHLQLFRATTTTTTKPLTTRARACICVSVHAHACACMCIFVCVCMCVCVCVCACGYVSERVCQHVQVCIFVRMSIFMPDVYVNMCDHFLWLMTYHSPFTETCPQNCRLIYFERAPKYHVCVQIKTDSTLETFEIRT